MNSSSEMTGIPDTAGEETQLDQLSNSDHATFDIAGLPVHVFGMGEVKTREVTVLFFLHGRLGRWEDGTPFIKQMLKSVKTTDKSLLIVTFDQRKYVLHSV